MTSETKPLLLLGEGRSTTRQTGSPQFVPKPRGPSPYQQGERFGPVFRSLAKAMEDERVQLATVGTTEMDPEHVLVFELAGSIQDFRKAVECVDGLEFLAEYLGEKMDPDDDFFFETPEGETKSSKIQDTVYAVMSDARAAGNLVSLFDRWRADPAQRLEQGLAKWKEAFAYLRSVRRWGVGDRVGETGLLEEWVQEVALAGQSFSPVQVEIELWYRKTNTARATAQAEVEALIHGHGGMVITACEIPDIKYHAILADLPRQVAEKAVRDGEENIKLLVADQVMFASPHLPMTVATPEGEVVPDSETTPDLPLPTGLPRIALLDGLPMGNHARLSGRLIIDDPDDLEPSYPVARRHHGTAMASLIIHGDIRAAEKPLDRPLYVRPIMEPRDVVAGEEIKRGILMTDLLHHAVRRIVEGDGTQPALAPSVRIINLSIGHLTRGTIRRMSPLGRLVDWLAVKYNLLFVVSAGNYDPQITVSNDFSTSREALHREAFRWYVESSRQRGILPPGDALNALTVGASHSDASGDSSITDVLLDVNEIDYPALFSATGPGVGRSIKPDLLHSGGRQVFISPVFADGQVNAVLEPARNGALGPGQQVAVPSPENDKLGYTVGTSNATALVTREASRLFDILESLPNAPDQFYHPVLVRALLVHGASWGDDTRKRIARELEALGQPKSRASIGMLLGHGVLNPERSVGSSDSRAVMLGWGRLKQEEETTFEVPLPPSLHARADWHRTTVTLAAQVKTVGGQTKYRSVRVGFDKPDESLTGGDAVDVDSRVARNGSVQHFVIDGQRAITITGGTSLPIRIECRKDAQDLAPGESISYGLVVSIETKADVSTTIFQEIEQALNVRSQVQPQDRIQIVTSANPTPR